MDGHVRPPVTTVLVIVLAWLVLSVLLGLGLAQVLGGISHGAAPRDRRDDPAAREESEHLARSA